MHQIAQDWLVLELTNSGQALGIVASAISGGLIAVSPGSLKLVGKAMVIWVVICAFLPGTTHAIDRPINRTRTFRNLHRVFWNWAFFHY